MEDLQGLIDYLFAIIFSNKAANQVDIFQVFHWTQWEHYQTLLKITML